MKIHTWAWLGWLAAGLSVLLTTRNPFYLLALVLVLFIFQISLPGRGIISPIVSLRFATSILIFSTLFNALISRFGETVLFQIPGEIPLISGNITLEAVFFGCINGLVLLSMFTLFTIINQILPVKNLVRLIPQALQPVALITTIALTFIPATQRQFNAIREAQTLRGQSMKRLRDWLPLFIPLLIGGLEQALQIAEAMTARGYTVQPPGSNAFTWQKWLLPAALVLIVSGGFLSLFTGMTTAGGILFAAGILLFLLLFLASGCNFKKSHYHEEHWNLASWLTLASALIVISIYLIPNFSSIYLAYDPYPRIALPALQPLPVLTLQFLLLPLLWVTKEENDTD